VPFCMQCVLLVFLGDEGEVLNLQYFARGSTGKKEVPFCMQCVLLGFHGNEGEVFDVQYVARGSADSKSWSTIHLVVIVMLCCKFK
jgi:hypothetical protein